MDTKLTSLFLFLLLLLLPSSTDASDPNKPTHPHHGSVHPSRGLVITVMLTLGLLLIAFFTLYFQRCRGQNLYSSRFPPAGPHANRGVAGAKPGLDRAVIDSFPTLVYSEARELSHHDHHRPVECAVCLSEFGDREKLRLLPGCKHAFHLDCIDMWLDSHTTCPVCRSQLDVGSPATAESTAAATTEVAVDVAGTWTEGERERFTLRLEPEVLSGCGSMGRGEGSSEGVHGVARWVGKTLSERWACRARTAPFDGSRGGGGGGTSGGPSTSATDASIV